MKRSLPILALALLWAVSFAQTREGRFSAGWYPKAQSVSGAETVTIDPGLGNVAVWSTHAGNETVNFGGAPRAGDTLTLVVTTDEAARTLTFGTGICTPVVGDTFTFSAPAVTMSVSFTYDGDVWRQVTPFVESDDD